MQYSTEQPFEPGRREGGNWGGGGKRRATDSMKWGKAGIAGREQRREGGRAGRQAGREGPSRKGAGVSCGPLPLTMPYSVPQAMASV